MASNNSTRDEQLAVRFTKSERALVEDEAGREALNLATFIRSVVMKAIRERRRARSEVASTNA